VAPAERELSSTFWAEAIQQSRLGGPNKAMKVIMVLGLSAYASLCFVAGISKTRVGNTPTATTSQEPTSKNAETKSAPQMEKLVGALSGEWTTEEIYEPSELLPKGGKGVSRDSYRVGPARLSLIEEYHGEGAAGKSWGIGVIWWDAEAGGFRVVWCDSYALDRGCRVSSHRGKWEGSDYVQTDEHEVAGKRVFEREVWTDFAADSYGQTLYVGNAADKLKRIMTIKATRVQTPRK